MEDTKVLVPRSDLSYTEGVDKIRGRQVRVAVDIEAETDALKSYEQLQHENQVLRERLARRGTQITELSKELSRAQEFATWLSALCNDQSDIISAVVSYTTSWIIDGRAPTGTRRRSQQIVVEELIDIVASTDVYQRNNHGDTPEGK